MASSSRGILLDRDKTVLAGYPLLKKRRKNKKTKKK